MTTGAAGAAGATAQMHVAKRNTVSRFVNYVCSFYKSLHSEL